MVRFLTLSACLLACLVACAILASRFTITLTIVPINGNRPNATTVEPAHEPAPAPKPAVRKPVDSHHTKGA